MEHIHSHRQVQGGGTGSGFQVPFQTVFGEPKIFHKVVQSTVRAARFAV